MPDRATQRSAHVRRVGGRYRLLDELGSGGMATVLRAHDDVLDRDVAVKLLHHHLAGDRAFLDRFRREARAAAALSHPNVVGVHDWGESQDGAFLVMQLVDGPSLRDVLSRGGALPSLQAAAALLPAAAGVASAHRAGLVHCDVKPENLLLGDDGVVRVTDFGLARAAATSTATFGDGVLVGSPHYLSPEAVRGEPLTPAADVYALGIVLYEALVGAPPHHGDSPYATAMAHAISLIRSPSERVPDVPAAVDDVVARATAKDPRQRYPDAAAFAEALAEAVPEAVGAAAPTVGAVGTRDGARDEARDTGRSRTAVVEIDRTARVTVPETRRRGWMLAVFTAVVVMASIAGGAYALWDRVLAPITQIPSVVGLPESAAFEELHRAGFKALPARERPHDLGSEAGDVLGQEPTGEARTGAEIELTLSAGPRQIEIPPLDGANEDDAVSELSSLGLETAVEHIHDEVVAADRVIDSDPGAGVVVDEASEVTITVSTGPRPIEVPRLADESLDEARTRLRELGLELDVGDRRFADAPAGTVLGQHPSPGRELVRGDVVTVEVSDGPEPIEVPSVRSEHVDDAIATLRGLGFEVEVERRGGFSAFINPGRVYDQDPAPRTTRFAGDVIRLYANEG